MRWFPRPASAADVEVLDAAALDAAGVFELLVASDAQEWRHKVGVAGRADGSGKTSTRLLAARGWILKTSVVAPAPSRDALRARLLADRQRGVRAGVCHPSKQWAMLRTHAGWLPLVVCRELRTLRGIDPVEARFEAWTRMLAMGIEVYERTELGLDLNPANFAEDEASPGLFYLDDELYPALSPQHVALAIVSRIPEEPEVTDEAPWLAWGRALRRSLRLNRASRAALVHEAASYPLPEAFHGRRTALLAGLSEEPETLRPPSRRASGADVVAILADVHANLPALEAVIEAARDRGAKSFLFLGDAVGYGPHPRQCVQVLAELGATLVGGNHDHAIATEQYEVGMNPLARTCASWTRANLGPAELQWLGSLEREQRGDGWMAVHGAPRDPHRFFAYVYELTYEENLEHLRALSMPLCFLGHTHVQLVHALLGGAPTKRLLRSLTLSPGNVYLVNPGSVGQPRDGDPRAAFALWDRSTGHLAFERVAYPVEQTARDVARSGLPREIAERLRRGV